MRKILKSVFKIFVFFALALINVCVFAQEKQDAASNAGAKDVLENQQEEYVAADDPFEGYNRKMYLFNEGIDKVIVHPLAVYYDNAFPWQVKKGVSNFFNNLEEVPNMFNDILQGNIGFMVNDMWRLLFNTTIGIGGLFDFASKVGLEKHRQDFGLTLAKWGVKKSPYLVLPFWGPETVRDAIGIPVDIETSVLIHLRSVELRYILKGIKIVETRANFLRADELIKNAFDPYVLIRDAYLQRREYLMNKHDNKMAKKGGDDEL